MVRAAVASILAGALLIPAPGQAALIDVELTTVTVYGSTPRNLNLAASTATWQYDDLGRQLIQTGGVYDAAYKLGPPSTVWHHVITDAILGFSTASASSFACVEGNFGALVGKNYCAGYDFGPNLIDESTSSWGPGLEYSRSIGGDDLIFAGIFSLDVYSSFREVSWDGETLEFGNTGCFGGANCDGLPNGWNGGFLFTLGAAPVVPVPATAWLFASALGGLLGARRWRNPANRPSARNPGSPAPALP